MKRSYTLNAEPGRVDPTGASAGGRLGATYTGRWIDAEGRYSEAKNWIEGYEASQAIVANLEEELLRSLAAVRRPECWAGRSILTRRWSQRRRPVAGAPRLIANARRRRGRQVNIPRLALIVIDMLVDFFERQPALAAQRAALAAAINDLARSFRAARQPVIWIRQEFKPDLSDGFLEMRRHGIKVTIEGTDGCRILPELYRHSDDRVIVKKRYSAFFGTALDDLLGEIRPDVLVLAGINTHACIRTTAILRAQGFFNAYAGITLPNAGSVALHEAVGFKNLGIYEDAHRHDHRRARGLRVPGLRVSVGAEHEDWAVVPVPDSTTQEGHDGTAEADGHPAGEPALVRASGGRAGEPDPPGLGELLPGR
jgi:nicotinamidase-related amidase